ncbi:amidohydrolase family protein [Tundrisphaera sp. TA3]|uniref:amidohydrolase family protein n=1 Tax=Tundrisphaera sp. TA3 TaxID=3435775 RepID=UPI003EBCAD1D
MMGLVRSATRMRSVALLLATGATVWSVVPLRSADLRPDYQPAAYAIRGARVVPVAGEPIDNGTVVVRDGVIAAVGPADKVEVPFDAEVIEGKGLVVYPGFLDLYTTSATAPGSSRSQTGAGRDVNYSNFALPRTPADNRNGITPEFEVAATLDPSAGAEEHRRLGFTDVLVAPGGAIATGQSALVSAGGLPRRESVVKTPVALHIALRSPGGSSSGEDHGHSHSHEDEAGLVDPADLVGPTPGPTQAPVVATPSLNPVAPPATPPAGRRSGGGQAQYPTSLMGVVAHLRQAMLDAENHHERLAYYDQKGGPRPPLDPALDALYSALARDLMVWWEANSRDDIHRALDLADEFNTHAVIVGGRDAGKAVARLRAENVPVVLRIDFPEEPKVPSEADYRKKPIEERDEPLKVLAEKASNWKERVAVARTLADASVPFAFTTDGLARADTFHAQLRKVIAAGLSREAAVDALTRRAAEIAGVGHKLGTIEPGKLGHLVVMTAQVGDEDAKVRYVLVDGQKFDLDRNGASAKKGIARKESDASPKGRRRGDVARPIKDEDEKADEPRKEEVVKKDDEAKEEPKKEVAGVQPDGAQAPPKTQEDQPGRLPFADIAAEFDADRRPAIKTGGTALIKDATILTVTRGTIPRGSILIRDGKIAEVGPNVVAPEGVAVIDASGLVAMPGIIDTHSHQAIQGGVNEMSLSIVPEVRVKDVVTGDDAGIYRALAGGTTAARLLHGSANTIGGQDAVIKHKPGQAGRDLILQGNPQGVKFALGENVTRRTGRFPNTRMGVEATIERAFEEGRAYSAMIKAYEAAKARGEDPGPPPRRDLRLEALGRIVEGSIKIHSHCYRSDEILMLLRVATRFGVRVQSLQHVLEGYKVAAEITAHGASNSTFSDWWAYKVEAFDAIPFNAALLAEAGAQVCIKSDSEELIRHLYLEAAKMVKYGGVSEEAALAMITINPARQLGLDRRLGSIEVGKDADIALFNAHPFDGFARCEMALIDGEVWFQRQKDGKPEARPGDHTAMPAAAVADAKAKALDLALNAGGSYGITGANLHPVSGPDISRGTIVISGGKIAAIGGPETPVPAGAKVVDAAGLDIWPGMLDAGSTLGLFEVGSLPETQDSSDSAEFQPELRSSIALHPDSELIPVSRANGVLSSFAQPGGGVISGQGCVIGLDGWVPTEMLLLDKAALLVTVPRSPRARTIGAAPAEGTEAANRQKQERMEAIREQFRRALAYDKVVATARDRHATPPTPDPRLAALAPYAKGEKPVMFRAEGRAEILDALKLASELKLRAIITGGGDAWKVADALKAAKVPVLINGTLRVPDSATDPYDAYYANPARLHEAGVAFAIKSGSGGSDSATAPRNLPYEAATAVAYGLPEAVALRSVTLSPAEILGVADKVGSLDVGKRADLVITAGHLLQPTTEVKGLFIAGKPVPPESRHTKLYSKYRGRLAEVRAGSAPLGLDPDPSSPAPSISPAPTPPANPAASSDRR